MEETQEIVGLELVKIEERLQDQSIRLEATPEAVVALAEKGYSEEFGARNLRRTVQAAIEDGLSEGILSGKFSEGSCVLVDVQDGEIVLEAKAPELPLLESMLNV
jgi:ATP-dependent Clp protease ATP-binding subunit ClpA